MQLNGQMRPPIGVVFDAAFGDNLDDFLALCLLYSLDNRNECRVVSLSTEKDNIHSAALLDILNRMYGGRPFPIGMAMAKQRGQETALLKAAMENQTPTIKSLVDTAEPHGLIRNALTAQHDGNAIAICVGPTDNFKDLLHLQGAMPVIQAKVKTFYIVGEDPKPLEGWPTPTVLVPYREAAAIHWKPVATDFSWNETHPAAQALSAAPGAKLNYAGMLTVLHAVRSADFPLPLPADKVPAVEKAFAELTGAKPIPRQRMRPPSA